MADLTPKQIVFTQAQHQWLLDQAYQNKRAGITDLDSISKIVRQAIEEYKQKTEGPA